MVSELADVYTEDWSMKLPSPSPATGAQNLLPRLVPRPGDVMYGTLGVYCYLYLFSERAKVPE